MRYRVDVAGLSTFLCWNLNRRPLQHLVAELARSRKVEVVILLECEIAPDDVLDELNRDGAAFQYAPTPAGTVSQTIRIFTRFPSDLVLPLRDSPRCAIRRVFPPGRGEFLLAALHFPSKLPWRDDSQVLECTAIVRMILEAEEEVKHNRTVLVGDLNMNPFESGVVGAAGFNATMTRRQASSEYREVQGRRYPFFFNPMWGHFGDGHRSPPGTYHYNSGEQVNYYWNMFDQVMLRPSLIDSLADDGVEIVTDTGRTSLLTPGGTPNKILASDHLPLLFRLEL